MAAVINLPARTPIALGNRCYHERIDTQSRQLRSRTNCAAISSSRSHKPPASISPCTPLAPRGRASIRIRAGAAGAAQPSLPDETPKAESSPVAKFKALLSPFSEPSTNKKLLALCGAQALSSVATLIHDTYLPLYLSEELKLSNTKIGNLQAMAQFLSNASKSLSGTLADILSPARMIIFGTLLTTINKPMFALSGYVFASFGTVVCLYWVTFAKVFDRMSKGVREAPGKALIGELAAESGDKTEGAFGLRQAMGTFGALMGSLIAGLAYTLSGRNYAVTFSLSALPALGALLLVTTAFGQRAKDQDAANKIKRKDAADKAKAEGLASLNLGQKIRAFMGALQPAYWQALSVVCLLYFARFDASFITLRARTVMDKAQLPVLMSIMMITQAVLSTPCGLRAKRSLKERNHLLLAGFGTMIVADLLFAKLGTPQGMMLGACAVGVHMAMTHAICLSMLSAYIPATEVPGLGRVSGTVWSFTDFVLGVVLAYSNSVAGKLADYTQQRGMGNIGCFYGGMVAVTLAGLMLFICSRFGDLGKEELVVTKKGSANLKPS
ncbi:hypothetical protein WJX79_000242 [Trebouxia sp. C0005]|nr:MAG: MFS transporter [Trebouxia sp. A1-2]